MEKLLISIGTAAKLLDCDRSTVSRRMDDGSIPWVWLGSRRMVHLAKLREQIDADAPASQYRDASGVVDGRKQCRINDQDHLIGGSLSHRQTAGRRLDDLLGRSTSAKPRP